VRGIRLGIQPWMIASPPRRLAGFSPALPASSGPIRVVLALPSPLWSQLLAQALNQQPGLAVEPWPSGAAPVRADAAVLVAAVPAGRAGWERLAHWCRRSDGLRVLVTGEDRPALAARALRLGACGYLNWDSSLDTLVKAIRGVHAGELWAERKVALGLIRARSAGPPRLTPRETRVLEALAEGKRNKEIAGLLEISETTVKSHLNRVYHKLHCSDRLQAALFVERHGLE
jgi:DNA-binding NarL/FixJ family response regulator